MPAGKPPNLEGTIQGHNKPLHQILLLLLFLVVMMGKDDRQHTTDNSTGELKRFLVLCSAIYTISLTNIPSTELDHTWCAQIFRVGVLIFSLTKGAMHDKYIFKV